MLSVVIAMLSVLVIVALVLTYVAFPHRGEDVPGARWLGQAMRRAVGAAPLVQADRRPAPAPRRETAGAGRPRG